MSSDTMVVESEAPQTVELDSQYVNVSGNSEEKEEESALVNFDYTQYLEYFPEDAEKYDFLVTMLKEQQYGWKTRAYMLLRCAELEAMLKEQKAKVADASQNKLIGKHGPRTPNPSNGLRTWLAARDDETLQKLCDKYSVSYASFSNDKPNMIEALLDEMERV